MSEKLPKFLPKKEESSLKNLRKVRYLSSIFEKVRRRLFFHDLFLESKNLPCENFEK